jgi:hypothetical protein
MSRTRLQCAFGARGRMPVLRAKVACVMTARSWCGVRYRPTMPVEDLPPTFITL